MASTFHDWTIADLLDHFGPIPAGRVRHDPAPGSATEQDVIEIEAREDRLYELIDGVLLEKVMGGKNADMRNSLTQKAWPQISPGWSDARERRFAQPCVGVSDTHAASP